MTYVRRTFKQMPVGTKFRTTPTITAMDWLKVSTRTARIGGNGACYYYGQSELAYIDEGHWNEMTKPETARDVPSTKETSDV